jgi:hypothetical protein
MQDQATTRSRRATKRCASCGRDRAFRFFRPAPPGTRARDGLARQCRRCQDACTLNFPGGEGLQYCDACGRRLPLDAFAPSARPGRRRSVHCRECLRARDRRRRGSRPRSTLPKAYWHTPAVRYTIVRASARVRGLTFALTREAFAALGRGPCAYCGQAMAYPALDRVDSTKGYEPDNVVPCCGMCNRMKLDHTEAAFLAHVRRIALHRRLVST